MSFDRSHQIIKKIFIFILTYVLRTHCQSVYQVSVVFIPKGGKSINITTKYSLILTENFANTWTRFCWSRKDRNRQTIEFQKISEFAYFRAPKIKFGTTCATVTKTGWIYFGCSGALLSENHYVEDPNFFHFLNLI